MVPHGGCLLLFFTSARTSGLAVWLPKVPIYKHLCAQNPHMSEPADSAGTWTLPCLRSRARGQAARRSRGQRGRVACRLIRECQPVLRGTGRDRQKPMAQCEGRTGSEPAGRLPRQRASCRCCSWRRPTAFSRWTGCCSCAPSWR